MLKLGAPASMLELVRDAGLAALGLDGPPHGRVKVFDLETRVLVRRLAAPGQGEGHRAPPPPKHTQ